MIVLILNFLLTTDNNLCWFSYLVAMVWAMVAMWQFTYFIMWRIRHMLIDLFTWWWCWWCWTWTIKCTLSVSTTFSSSIKQTFLVSPTSYRTTINHRLDWNRWLKMTLTMVWSSTRSWRISSLHISLCEVYDICWSVYLVVVLVDMLREFYQ